MESVIARAKKPAIVIAHPDDSALWCSGAIIRHPNDWLIICCTIPFRDPERKDCFFRECDELGVTGIHLNHPERRHGPIPFDKLDYILQDRDLIITHGLSGEYGHHQHKECHHEMRARYLDKLVWLAYADEEHFRIKLTDDEWERKLRAIKCYDNQHDQTQKTHERLLEYFAPRFDLKNEPYGVSTQCLNRFND